MRNNNGPHNVVQFATEQLSASSWPAAPSGNSVTAGANDLTAPGVDASSPAIAVEPDGTTTVSWQLSGANQQRTRASGGSSFAAAAGIPTTLTSPGAASLAAGPNGGVIAILSGTSGGQSVIGAATRASGAATFSTLPNQPGTGNNSPIAGLDDQGNVPAAWLNSTSGNTTVQASALDVAAPTISNATFPTTAVSGTPFPYSATVSDRWSTVSASWAFGDGATGALSGTHTYAAAGSFLATLTATDGVGNSTQTTKTIQVSAPPPSGGGGGGGGTTGPTTPPTVASLKLSPTAFKAASRHKPKGKKLKSCQRFISKGSFTHTDKVSGPVSFRFAGRVRGHKLAVGTYRLQAVGSNVKGKGKAVVTPFRIVKR